MDWETKFSSIVRETESNLAKVKQRLGSARAQTNAALNFNGTDKLAMSDPARYGSSYSSGAIPTTHYPTTNYAVTSGVMTTSPFDMPAINSQVDLLSLDQSPGIITLMQDKLEAQNRVLESFGRTIRRMEEERELYHKALRQLRDELTVINTRVNEKGVDLVTERKMDGWRRDMLADIQMMQSQVQMMRCRDDELSNANQAAAYHRETADMKRFVMEECDNVRREVDSIKTRVVKMEIKVASVETDSQDLMRKQDKLERSLSDLVKSHTTTSRELTASVGSRSQEIMEISELKSSLRTLRDKIGTIEANVQDKPPVYVNTKKQKNDKRNKRTKSRPPPGNLLSPDSSDLDLSDTTDLADLRSEDFSFSPNKAKAINKSADEELDDLDELDLSTEDLLSSMLDTAELT